MKLLVILFVICSLNSGAQIRVQDFYSDANDKNDTRAIQMAMHAIDSIGHGTVEFEGTKNYVINATIQLPRYKNNSKRLIVLNGNGCQITSKQDVVIFMRKPEDQKEALNNMMSTRFLIQDFSFVGGEKAIELCASYGSTIQRCNFTAQKTAAIDVQFGLNTVIEHCHFTNAKTDAIILRCGEDWGGNGVNSQSNHSIISACRVYAGKGSNSAIKILGSSGVVVRDFISEGSAETNYSIYFDREKSNCVRLFTIENFHLEHAPKIAAIYLNHTGIATIDGIYYQLAYASFALIKAAAGAEQITLRNIPHYVDGTVCCLGNNEVPVRVEYCHKSFYDPKTWCIDGKDGTTHKLPYYFSGIGGKFQINKTFGK